MQYNCRKCGKSYETDDVTEFFCEDCRNKKKDEPNKDIVADVREAMRYGLSYGEYKDRMRRRK